MRRYLPLALLCLASVAPVLGCDLLKKKTGEGAEDGAVAAPATTTTPAAAATETATAANPTGAAPTTPAPPLGTTAPQVAPNGQPAVKPVDGGAAPKAADGGAAPPPTPTLQLPGFDAGAFKGFDAGGLFKGFDAGGFKPPF